MRKILLLAVALLASVSSFAGERSDSELKAIAKQQMGISARRMAAGAARLVNQGTLALERTLQEGGVVVYASQGAGSVIMSLDDRFPAVLGYTAGVIDAHAKLPDGLKWWLGEMNRMMTAAVAQKTDKLVQAEEVPAVTYKEVGPLLTTSWDQDRPYNSLCPEMDGEHALVGCGATALAQILNYNQYPKSVSFKSCWYDMDNGYKETSVTVQSTYTYPYKDTYGYWVGNSKVPDYTEEEENAIAALCRDCGYALGMSYGLDASSSSSFWLPTAATAYLNYPEAAVKYLDRYYYSDNEWHQLIYNELARNYPIYYTGYDSSSGFGHAFVVDGVDTEGKVHVNWGWSGDYNGWFSMDLMDPYSGCTFSATGQTAVVGFHPTALESDRVQSMLAVDRVYISNGEGNEQIKLDFTLDPDYPDFDTFWNISYLAFTGKILLCVEDVETGNVKTVVLTELRNKENGYGDYFDEVLCIDDYLKDMVENNKTYKLYCAASSEDEYRDGIYNKLRLAYTGAIYFNLTVDENGGMTITDYVIDNPTGIKNIGSGNVVWDGKRYNLNGMRVGDNYKGVVIKNGKKYVK